MPIIDHIYMVNCNADIWAPKCQKTDLTFGGTGEKGEDAIEPGNFIYESKYCYHFSGSLKIDTSQTVPRFGDFQGQNSNHRRMVINQS